MFAQRINFELLSNGMDVSFSRTQWTTVNVNLSGMGTVTKIGYGFLADCFSICRGWGLLR